MGADSSVLSFILLGTDHVAFSIVWMAMLGLGIMAGIMMAVSAVVFSLRFFHDAFRFGREGYPFWWFALLAAIFSSAGWLLAGLAVAWLGPFFLAVYGLGRWRGEAYRRRHRSLNL